ncbi:MAG: 3-oxoacyl-ACP reductase [Bryobacterales bacterium]|nr:3-oxoacyl-ACP reductase [Bryobacterales bacterium]
MSKLTGKIAVITGGSSGIGLATAEQFVAEGAYVYITGRRRKELDAAVAQIGRNVTGVQGDVANLEDIDRLYAQIAQEKRRIDILFANAGIASQNALIGQITELQFDLTFGINVRGLLFSVQKALPLMPDGASIIINGSAASIKAIPTQTVYSATKAAVRSFARTWTSELRERKIRVNTVSPGYTDTPIVETLGWPKEQVDAIVAGILPLIPVGRFGRPEEIAKTVLFLASDDSSYITGVELFVDGGGAQI